MDLTEQSKCLWSIRKFDLHVQDLPYDPTNVFIAPYLTTLQRERAFTQRENKENHTNAGSNQ